MLVLYMIADCWSLTLLHPLMYVSTEKADILVCITQTTHIVVNIVLLSYNWKVCILSVWIVLWFSGLCKRFGLRNQSFGWHLIEMKVTGDIYTKEQVSDERDSPIRIVLLCKDQKLANAVRHQFGDLSRKNEMF
mgnify:CR=1 FL=1